MGGMESRRRERTSTRASFVERLRDWRDDSTWGQFLARYGRLIHDVATRSGLRRDEADEVVQDTALSVARKMPSFEYRPGQCSFEGWVRRMARLRVMDQLRKRAVDEGPGACDDATGSGTGDTAPLERVADPGDACLGEAEFDASWRQAVLEAAVERLRQRVSPEQFQIFQLNVLDDVPGTEVAGMLDVSIAKVYVVRHRLIRLLKQEVERIQRSLDAPVSA